MNANFMQAKKRFQMSSFMVAGFVLFTVLVLIFSLSRIYAARISVPSGSMQPAHTENRSLPDVNPVPTPPAEQLHAAPEAEEGEPIVSIPLAIPAPMPSVP